jgi:lipopolysaccharide/colanic/teichoic acid biosynthesis glycosyltransferase
VNEAGGPRLGRGLPRPLEAALAFAGLAVASPVIAACAAAVVLTSGRPAFFRQIRVGRGGRPFRLVKLRSMRGAPAGPRVTARGDDRVTPVGRVLRRTKLDELPELWNVLRGEMSFVGPRPEVPEYVDLADPRWAEVLQARPGLTDPVTLALRDEEDLMESVAGDRERYYRETLQPRKLAGYRSYLERRTWRTDVGVIWNTVMALLPGRSTERRTSDQGPDLPDRPVGA